MSQVAAKREQALVAIQKRSGGTAGGARSESRSKFRPASKPHDQTAPLIMGPTLDEPLRSLRCSWGEEGAVEPDFHR